MWLLELPWRLTVPRIWGQDRLKESARACATIMGSIYGVILAIPMMTVGKYLVHFFVSENAGQIMNQADIYLKWTFLFMIPLTIVNV